MLYTQLRMAKFVRSDGGGAKEDPTRQLWIPDLTQRREDAARQAATKESEQEETEKTEGKKLCRKCRVFADSTAKRKVAARPAATKAVSFN